MASLPRSFTFEEALETVGAEIDREVLRHALLVDKRFVVLDREASEGCFFIPETTLFRWFAYLTLRLAQARQAKLTAHQLAISMSSLRLDGRWDLPPVEAVDFGYQFGFVARAGIPGQYVFPLAWLLSRLPRPVMMVASSILESLAEKENRHAAFGKPIECWMQEGLSHFNERVVYVVQRREGLLPGAQATLDQIGSDLGITRARVQQIDAKFWQKLSEHPEFQMPFIKGFVCAIMRRQGSLVVSTRAYLIRFLAKCAGVPQAEVPHTGLVILGASADEVARAEPPRDWLEGIDAGSIAACLESMRGLCLSADDLKVLCGRLASFHQEHLTTPQRVCLALRAIGRPAHYSAVTEVHNSLFPKHLSTEYIHAVLSREDHGVVWIGVRGTFALRDWGYERPSKPLYDAVADIVEATYKQTGRPVPFNVIVAEIGKYRKLVKPPSLALATCCNPRLRRVRKDSFIPKQPGDEVQEDLSADELDRILREFGSMLKG